MRIPSDTQSYVQVVNKLPPGLDPQELLLQFLEVIEEASSARKSQREDSDTPEVLLEVEIDEARYTLTRTCPQAVEPEVSLSPREKEIVRLVAKGLPNKTIAAVLEISPWTVATHLRRVFGKLGVGSRAEMVACVLKEGLIRLR